MIKGVNKQIIEINDPESKYFEKAVLYIRPEYADVPRGKICHSAKELINEMSEVDLWSMDLAEAKREGNQNSNRRRLMLSIIGSGVLAAGILVFLLLII